MCESFFNKVVGILYGFHLLILIPAGIYLLKVNNGNTSRVNNVFLVYLLLTLDLLWCFHFLLSIPAIKYQLEGE